MAVSKRTATSSAPCGQNKTDPSLTPKLVRKKEPAPTEPRRLLSNTQVPVWYADCFILTGYRPVTLSIRFCLESLAYMHNETVNIYTHLIPAICSAILAVLASQYFASTFPRATSTDTLVFQIYLATSVVCFGVSSLYHTLLCHSRYYRDLWVRIDYVAIVFQILGSFVPGIYVGFYCERHLQRLYWSMVSTHLKTSLPLNSDTEKKKDWSALDSDRFCRPSPTPAVSRFPRPPDLQFHRHGSLRLRPDHPRSVYLSLPSTRQASGAAVLLPRRGHCACRSCHLHCEFFPKERIPGEEMDGESLANELRSSLNQTRFPEAWRPGKFDIWGASHQIFHVLVVISAMVHLYGILSAFRWNYENPRCPTVVS